ncbi:MAG: hypothetical protein F4X83_06765 [Chloroflexi bacterium]|nr:hypothetical protein [Chloroflexota bacterium]
MKINARSQLPYLRDNISEIASTCQPLWHPLGFVSCVIRREEDEFTTRVHYWPRGNRRTKEPNWPIHNHAYELSSHILAGCVRDIQYRLVRGNDYAIYSVSYAGENSTITLTNRRTSLEKLIDQFHLAGEDYSVSVDTFHETDVPMQEQAISLVVQSNFRDTEPLVLGTGEGGQHSYDRIEFDRVAFWSQVRGTI